MGIRIRPQEIEAPADDPFKYDLLNRKESVEVLTRLVGAFEGPCVLAVDAAWGNGKSTFIKIWAQHLRNKGFPVVAFNAWETDFSRDPFVALSSELTEGLAGAETDDSIAEKLERMREAGKEVLKRSIPAIVRLATAGILDISPFAEQEIGQLLASYAEERLAEYVEIQNSVRNFKSVLQDLAETLSTRKDNQPLVIFIDELDRCRPSYAIELLEIAKHFFSVDRIVFVLAVNRAELAHSIKAFYGSEFDAIGYLRRFIDVDFRLPDPDRKAYVNAMFAKTDLDEYFEEGMYYESFGSSTDARKLLRRFFSVPDFSLRRIAQAFHRLGLVFASLDSEKPRAYLPIATALILRTIDADLYHRFFRGDLSDIDVADDVFNRPGIHSLRHSTEGALFETMLILAPHEDGIGEVRRPPRPERPDETDSALLKQYRGWTSKPPSELDREHAHRIIDCIRKYQHWIDLGLIREEIGFKMAVDRLELFSTELMDENMS